MKIIEETMCYTSLTRLLECVFDGVENAKTHISCFLIAPDKSSKDMSNVGRKYFLTHHTHALISEGPSKS